MAGTLYLGSLKEGEINLAQARKFCRCLKLSSLRIENGEWWADDCGEPYRIDRRTYYAALEEGDLNDGQ